MLLCIAAPAAAHPGARFWLGAINGQVVPHQQPLPGVFTPDQVFERPLDEVISGVWATDFPGFEVFNPGGNVAGGTIFGIRLTGPLLRLNAGMSALEEMIQPTQPRLAVTLEGADTAITNAGVQDGFDFFQHNVAGDHEHLSYILLGDGQNPGGGDDGAYVLPMQLAATGLQRSDWFFLILGKNVTAPQQSAAMELTRDMADAIPGDTNFDRTVNIVDFSRLASSFNVTGKWWAYGDFTFDGAITITDFSLLASNFNRSSPMPAGARPVPEPTCSAAAFLLGALSRRRRGL
jgi:hypothetical protein